MYLDDLTLLYGKVNPSVLIGCLMVGILPYGPFRWKRSKPCIFLFSIAGRFKTTTRKHVKYSLSSNRRRMKTTTNMYQANSVIPKNQVN